jgi:aldose 1-epimerase
VDATVEQGGLACATAAADGEQGYPGNLDATVVYSLTEDNEIVMRFHAVTDQPTPVNLTQHSYFNLAGAGAGDILAQEITIDADKFVPIDAGSIPLGPLAPGHRHPLRLPPAARHRRAHRPAGQAAAPRQRLRPLLGAEQGGFRQARADARGARARSGSGRVLELFTQEPGVQFYSGNFLDGSLQGKGHDYSFRSGFCIEPQHFPDSPNQPAYPNTILRPGEVYETESRYRFSVVQ